MENEFKTIDEQIEELKLKGLKFKNEARAKRILLMENYYYLTQDYEDVFLDLKKTTEEQDVYVPETYFEELFAIYKLDRELRDLIFDYINLVETHMKSFISYAFSKKYGYKDYLKRENFIPGEKFDKRIEKLIDEIEDNKQRNFKNPKSVIKEYFKEKNFLPLWVLIKVFTFGNVTNFYDLMKLEDKQEVAQYIEMNAYSVTQYLKMLNIIRNICAHGDILFNIRLDRTIYINDFKEHEELKIEKQNGRYVYGLNDLFAVVIILKKMIDAGEFSEMFLKIEKLLSDVRKELDETSFNNLLKCMGFPKNYALLDSI